MAVEPNFVVDVETRQLKTRSRYEITNDALRIKGYWRTEVKGQGLPPKDSGFPAMGRGPKESQLELIVIKERVFPTSSWFPSGEISCWKIPYLYLKP